jgi:hypothetical protein
MDYILLVIISLLILILFMSFRHTWVVIKQPECSLSSYGCCPDGSTSKLNYLGSNCVTTTSSDNIVGGCASTRYGCCQGTNIAKANATGTNCPGYYPPPPPPPP